MEENLSGRSTREELNAAARALVADPPQPDNFDDWIDWHTKRNHDLEIVNNWRSSHSYPLNIFQMTLRRYARKVDETALIAQRIKRWSSIATKLQRFPKMKMSQMQDIGGCRAVVQNISVVRRLAALYVASNIKHVQVSTDDYIKCPQMSGYRGIHLVYRYYSDKKVKSYNGLKIEIQLRSQYQHAWATAVETVGTFVQQALKSSAGQPEWLRFFALMGTAIALRERSAPVPDTPINRNQLVRELRRHVKELDVVNRLKTYGTAMKVLRGDAVGVKIDKAHYYLLTLDPSSNSLTISGFQFSELKKANDAYLEAEKQVRLRPGTDAVLVSVDSLAALERAYPNYFADTRIFLELLEQTLKGEPRRITTQQLSLPLV